MHLPTASRRLVSGEREITVPVGTRLKVELETTVASNANQSEDPVRARLVSPILVDGVTVVPADSVLLGQVTAAAPSGDVKDRARLGMRFDQLRGGAVTYDVQTKPIDYVAESTKRDDAVKIGLGAAAGAVIGGLAGGGKGAAVGSAIGGGAGTALVLTTPGEEVRIRAGTPLEIELTAPVVVAVPRRAT